MKYVSYRIRKLRQEEIKILGDFLYEAIFIPEGTKAPPKEIVKEPELQVYVADFGKKKDDSCYVAETSGKIAGAVWCRIMDDYGHVDNDTPSLAISVLEEFRHCGIGTALMQHMLTALKQQGYPQVSLSVQKANYAARMYKNSGLKLWRIKRKNTLGFADCEHRDEVWFYNLERVVRRDGRNKMYRLFPDKDIICRNISCLPLEYRRLPEIRSARRKENGSEKYLTPVHLLWYSYLKRIYRRNKLWRNQPFILRFPCPVGTSQLDKLKKLCVAAGIKDIDMDGKFVAIKMHFGEMGNMAFLAPELCKSGCRSV